MSTIQDIVFVRHGEGLHNAKLPHGPYITVPLTEHGVTTAAQVTERLRQANVLHAPEVIFCTTHVRGQQTAENYRSAHSDVPFILRDDIREWHNFDTDEKSILTVEIKMPMWVNQFTVCDPDLRGNEWGETFRDFVTRVQSARQDLLADPRDRIVCFSHALFMLGLVLELQGRLEATADCICLIKDSERTDNLDIIHIQHHRQTGEITITRRVFEEYYATPRTYPGTQETVPTGRKIYHS